MEHQQIKPRSPPRPWQHHVILEALGEYHALACVGAAPEAPRQQHQVNGSTGQWKIAQATPVLAVYP